MAEARHYKLSSQLVGHAADVRGACVCSDTMIATASRDKTIRLWQKEEESNQFKETSMFLGHENYVGTITWIPPSQLIPSGGFASGGMDNNVMLWSLNSSEPLAVYKGHQQQVTSVAAANDAVFSASVDRTVRKWTAKGPVVLRGHWDPVQAVLPLPDGRVVSGSTDKTIKFWKGEICVKTINAHTDTVRALALMPDIGFVSASHDGSLKIWSFEGAQIMEMLGHRELVYSVAVNSSNDVASGGEDCFAKIWKGGECFQSIEHPGCVWCVQFLPNGDLVTGCSDGVARVWTQEPSRYASAEEIARYEEIVQAREARKIVSGVDIATLPGPEALQVSGTADGQSKLIREGDSAVAYSWNMKTFQWDKIGEVVDGPDGGRKYDFEFDVDVGDSVMRKLPYNRGDNVYDVARRWLLSEGLQLEYMQQVIDFLLKHTGQQNPVDNRFYDPYTGGSAYVPSQTPDSGYQMTSTIKLKRTPRKQLLLFDTAKYDGMLAKLTEFNHLQGSNALSAEEVLSISNIVHTLKDTAHYHTTKIPEEHLDVVRKKLLHWADLQLFPVLDFIRQLMLHLSAADYFARHKDLLLDIATRASEGGLVNAYLSAKIIVNTFKHECFWNWLLEHGSQILDIFSVLKGSQNRTARLTYIYLVTNYAVRLIDAGDEEGQIRVLSAAVDVAEEEQDREIKFYALQTISNLVHGGKVKAVALELISTTTVAQAKQSGDIRIAEVGQDLDYLLK